jgi:hypothetical protein
LLLGCSYNCLSHYLLYRSCVCPLSSILVCYMCQKTYLLPLYVPVCWSIRMFPKYSHRIFWIWSMSVMIFHFSSLILLTWVFIPLLVNMDKVLLIVLYFSKTPVLLSLIRCIIIFVSKSFFWGTGAWTQGFHLEPLHQTLFLSVFSIWVSWTICLRLALNHDPPDLCLLSSWDYRREPPAPSSIH